MEDEWLRPRVEAVADSDMLQEVETKQEKGSAKPDDVNVTLEQLSGFLTSKIVSH